jgi:drug/metabolite transporter (DMT)-like permease
MSVKKVIGILLVVLGVVSLVWGGVFWTDRETIIDAGPLEVTADEREGIGLPPVLGILSLVGGIVLLAVPNRRRV